MAQPDYWTTWAKRTQSLEDKYEPSVFKAMQAFRKVFIDNIRTEGIDYALSRLSLTYLDPKINTLLRLMYENAGLMGARMTYNELKEDVKGKKSMNLKAGSIGRNETWIRDVLDFLRMHLLKFVNDITETMRKDVLRILEKSFEEQLSIEETVNKLQEQGLMRARARVIARTEIVRAANVGHAVAAQDTPYEVVKKWSAARDHRTRHSHREVNGKVVDENDTFRVAIYKGDKLVGYENMLYPGDANASVGNCANCRCRAVYTAKRDAQGNLIMRTNTTPARVIPMQDRANETLTTIAAQLKNMIYVGQQK